MKKIARSFGASLFCGMLLFSLAGCTSAGSGTGNTGTNGGSSPVQPLGDMTAVEVAEKLNIGWNLGNSFDAYSNGTADETAWGNPKTTKELINAVKAAGFDTIRIPVSYLGRVGEAPDYTIEAAWLDRIQEVVDYALDAGLYTIINIHHDGNNDKANGAWIDCTAEDQKPVQDRLSKLWAQIAARFAEYDERLIFESMNEIHDGSYQAPRGESGQRYYANVNALNQVFVDTVRASGGKNADRWLLVPGYNTNIDYTIAGFALPEDPANRLMVSVHFYDPYQYALEENFNTSVWGRDAQGNCGWGNEDFVDAQFDKLESTYVNNGIPVIIGEYGAINKNKDEYRNYYMEYVTKAACERNLVPVYWDNGYNGDFGFALFDRNNGAVLHEGMLEAMQRASSDEDYTVKAPK